MRYEAAGSLSVPDSVKLHPGGRRTPVRRKKFRELDDRADKTYIVDRTRGILPGSPRLVQAGVKYAF